MKGAIIGDIIGSAFVEDHRLTTDFQLFKPISSFTDDTILTIATTDSIVNNLCFKTTMRNWLTKYPEAGYNIEFKDWVMKDTDSEYLSYRDGAARRISSVGFIAETIDQAMKMAEETTKHTHNTSQMIKAAKAVSVSTFLAKTGVKKEKIKEYITANFDYPLNKSLDELKELQCTPVIDTIAPVAITIFLLSDDYEDAIRKSVSLGCKHCNTIASIVGGISQAYYKHIPKSIRRRALSRITPEIKLFVDNFEEKYVQNSHPIEAIMGMH